MLQAYNLFHIIVKIQYSNIQSLMYPPDFPSYLYCVLLNFSYSVVHLYILFKHSIWVIPLLFEVGKIFLQAEWLSSKSFPLEKS